MFRSPTRHVSLRHWFAVVVSTAVVLLAPAVAGSGLLSSPEFPTDGPIEAPVDPDPTSAVAGAVADLAERLNVDPSMVTVVSVQNVTWPNTALGCPQPGRAYAQVLRDGQRIILLVGETQYAYHSAGGPAFYCPNPA